MEFINCTLIELSFLSVTVQVSNFLMNDQFFMIFFKPLLLFAPVGAYDGERVKKLP